ncbi:MAG: PEP-CTERM sorting domain-containing protein [Phycisphaerae bacterium]|jgi:hypothetical protein
MKIKSMVLICVIVFLAGLLSSNADGGIYYGRYWGVDAYTTWNYYTTWTTVPTGYWGGWYNYNYGGYSWGAYSGWYHPYNGYYAGYYGSYWGWGSPSWYYGFTDYYSYRTTFAWPRTIYTWSRYWDPEDTGYTMDFYTEIDGDDKALAIDSAIGEAVEVGDHYWSYNGGEQEGTFTNLEWVTASPSALQVYLLTEGFDADTINDILGEQILLDAFASNYDSESGLYGDMVIGVQWTSYDIPEPTTIILLAAGLLAIKRKK